MAPLTTTYSQPPPPPNNGGGGNHWNNGTAHQLQHQHHHDWNSPPNTISGAPPSSNQPQQRGNGTSRPPFLSSPAPHHSSSNHHGTNNGNSGSSAPPPRFHQSPPVDPNPNLYIHNVPKDATEGELRDLFSTFGKVERIRLKVNQKIGPQALYAFVTFQTTPEAQAALERLNGFDMRGRKLRIEFQRSRGDDDRHFDDRPSSYYESGGGYRDRSAPRGDRRKRGGPGGGFSDQYNDSYGDHEGSGGPSFKRARYFETERGGDHGRSGGGRQGGHGTASSTSPYRPSQTNDYHSTGNSSTSYDQQDLRSSSSSWQPQQQQQQPRIPILLYDLLRQLKPHLFNQSTQSYSTPSPSVVPPTASSVDHQLFQQRPFHQTVTSPTRPQHQISPLVQPSSAPPVVPQQASAPSAPTSAVVPPPSQSVQPPSAHLSGNVNWLGFLARNNKRKVPIEIVGIDGPMESFLGSDTNFLNISHRSSFEDVAKKPAGSICFIRLASQDLSESGQPLPMTPQKKETYRKGFGDHLEYLTAKGRAGVVTLTDKKQLYIIPPGTPLFDTLRKGVNPSEPQVLLGLFTHAASTGSPHAAPAAGPASTTLEGPSAGLSTLATSEQQYQPQVMHQQEQSMPATVQPQPTLHQQTFQQPPQQQQQQQQQYAPPPQQQQQPPIQSQPAFAPASAAPTSLMSLLSNPQLLASLKNAVQQQQPPQRQ